MLCDSNNCTACAACLTKCPQKCIKLEYDNRGYSHPVIDESMCTRCGLCETACPIINPFKKSGVVYPRVYCAKSKNNGLLFNSASGGIATEITRYFTQEIGEYATGVINDEDHIPRFVLLNGESEWHRVSGSKYVHSCADRIYEKVKRCLSDGRKVFFCGLPCQVAALYSFLGEDSENLYTADIVCHGSSEERVYKDYLSFLQNKKQDKIINIDHTSKDKGWSILIQRLLKIEFESGEVLYKWSQQDPYLSLFLDGSIFRPSCYECRFASLPRIGDITLGDFFGIGTIHKFSAIDENGISMVMINSIKGQELFDTLSSCIYAEKRDIREAIYYNLNLWKPSRKSSIHDDLEKDIVNPDWDEITKKYYCSFRQKLNRNVRKAIKSILGNKTTAKCMLLSNKFNGTTREADKLLHELKKNLDSNI